MNKKAKSLRIKMEIFDKLVTLAQHKSEKIGYDLKWTQLASLAISQYIEREKSPLEGAE